MIYGLGCLSGELVGFGIIRLSRKIKWYYQDRKRRIALEKEKQKKEAMRGDNLV